MVFYSGMGATCNYKLKCTVAKGHNVQVWGQFNTYAGGG